jgi:hypothetical protein
VDFGVIAIFRRGLGAGTWDQEKRSAEKSDQQKEGFPQAATNCRWMTLKYCHSFGH